MLQYRGKGGEVAGALRLNEGSVLNKGSVAVDISERMVSPAKTVRRQRLTCEDLTS